MNLSEITSDWIQNVLKWDEKDAKIEKIKQIGVGNGMLGEIYRVQTTTKSFVIKFSPKENDFLLQMQPFEREAKTYELLGVSAKKLKGYFPKHYWTKYADDGSGIIVMEDLTVFEAVVEDALKGLEIKHIKAALKSIAKIHALHAHVSNNDAKSVTFDWMLNKSSKGLIAIIENALSETQKIIENRFSGNFSMEATNKLQKWNTSDILSKSHQKSKLSSICHGDLWSSNIMFYETKKSPHLSAFIIDWQFTTLGNPLIDVAFLVLSALEPELRKQQEKVLVRYYYEALKKAMHIFLDYSFQDCWEDYQLAKNYGTLMSLANMETFLSTTDTRYMNDLIKRLSVLLEEYEF